MLILVTGVPGAGKTLYTVTAVKERAEREKRQVFYAGIPELKLDWQELAESTPYYTVDARGNKHDTGAFDPHWQEVPAGSIVVLDEAWRFFPPRKQGAVVPPYVEPLATHRHRGLDIYITTQATTQLDMFVRKLVGEHVHLDRRFGMERAALLKWASAKLPEDKSDRASALRETFSYPKSSYGLYKSAEVHTHRLSLPWKKLALMGVALIATVLFAMASYGRLHGSLGGAVKVAPGSTRGHGAAAVAAAAPGGRGAFLWAPGARLPRFKDVPESAPAYDQVESVKSAPNARGCMEWVVGHAVTCTCNDSQGGVLDVPLPRCVEMVKRGWFDPTRAPEDDRAENVSYLNARDQRNMAVGDSSTAGPGGPTASTDTPSGSTAHRTAP